MKLAVITTAFFPAADVERQLRMFLTSANKYAVKPIIPYGIDEPYCIWADMKIIKKIPLLKILKAAEFSHVLYTDARDAFWTGSLDEVKKKYADLGSPHFLASTERTCNPNKEFDANYEKRSEHGYNYHCVGGYIGAIDWVIWALEKLALMRDRSGDDAEIWQLAWNEGWFRFPLDRDCKIFQTISDGAEGHLKISSDETGLRLYNEVTKQMPCIFHLNGGHSDSVRGKWDQMKPWWDRVHPELKGIEAV